MARSVNQKGKILYLAKILQETGENRTVSMQEILEKLLEKGIMAERKSIYDDLEVLRSFGMDIKFRRGKPGGYYLTGQISDEKPVSEKAEERQPEKQAEKQPEEEKTEAPVSEKKCHVEPEISKDTGKEIKLLCNNSRRQEIEACFGTDARYKEKGQDSFTVTACIEENPAFYGWLTAMGKSVLLLKPKKVAQAYRDYIKALAKEYKGV